LRKADGGKQLSEKSTMRLSQRLIAAAVLVALSGALAGCGGGGLSSWDPTDLLDFLDTKKKLPGERKPVFPDGVPGLEQGVPKDLYKGSAQEQLDQQNAAAVAPPAPPPEEPKQAAKSRGKKGKPAATASTAAAPEPDAAAEGENTTAGAPPPPKPKKIVRRRTTAPPPDQQAAPPAAPAQQQSAAPFPAPLPSNNFQR
jgi:hypothetical protein